MAGNEPDHHLEGGFSMSLMGKFKDTFSKKLTYNEAVKFTIVGILVTLLVAGLAVQGITALCNWMIGA